MRILASGRAVTLRFHPPADAKPGEQPVFGRPVAMIPNARKQQLRVPLGRITLPGQIVTLVFDVGQPGMIYIANPLLSDSPQ